MPHTPINRGAASFDDLCRCNGDPVDEYLVDELSDDEFEDEPCPDCGGRAMRSPPPVWMLEEEDDC